MIINCSHVQEEGRGARWACLRYSFCRATVDGTYLDPTMTIERSFALPVAWIVKIVFPTAGVHPYHVEGCGSLEDAMASIAALATLEEGISCLRIDKYFAAEVVLNVSSVLIDVVAVRRAHPRLVAGPRLPHSVAVLWRETRALLARRCCVSCNHARNFFLWRFF